MLCPGSNVLHNAITDNNKKAKLLNDFFVNQTKLDDTGATLPTLLLPDREPLNIITITNDEVRSDCKHLNWESLQGPII